MPSIATKRSIMNPMTVSKGTIYSDSSDPDVLRKSNSASNVRRALGRRERSSHGEETPRANMDKTRPTLVASPRSSASIRQLSEALPQSKLDRQAPEDDNEEERLEREPLPSGEPVDRTVSGAAKDKKKGVSFLNRFISTKTKDYILPARYVSDDASQLSDSRPEGMDAELFSQNINNIAYNPKYPQPPAYIKVRTKNKRVKEFDHVFLAQELDISRTDRNLAKAGATSNSSKASLVGSQNSVWAMEFSKSGKYLAVGSQDGIVRIYAVLGTPDDRRQFEADAHLSEQEIRLSAPVLHQRVFRKYDGHKGAITDLNWSRNDFLISSSIDKTIRLWHPSRTECLCTFEHSDRVLSIRFHPADDRFFLAGGRDGRMRLWSIPDKSVAYSTRISDVVTAVAFTPDGKECMAGTMNGVCYFFDTEGLKPRGKLIAKSNHGKNSKGAKINSISAFEARIGSEAGLTDGDRGPREIRILISSADSRIRLYNASDRSLEAKFKGHKAEELPIRAHVSDCGQYITTGSEDRSAHIWTNGAPERDGRNGQRPMECFDAHKDQRVTVTITAPMKARQLLAQSQDPIYELCHPPPVQLLSRSESLASTRPTDNESVQDSPPRSGIERPPYRNIKHYESARAHHKAGQIIVTASGSGIIRIYRQDCAHMKRKTFEAHDNASIFSGGRSRPSSQYIRRAVLGRENSVSSQTSVQRSDSINTQPAGERIMSWRQGISSNASLERDRAGSSASSQRLGSDAYVTYKIGRNNSPRKSVGSASMFSAQSRPTGQGAERSPARGSMTVPELILPESPGNHSKDEINTTPTNTRHPQLNRAPSNSEQGEGLEPPNLEPTHTLTPTSPGAYDPSNEDDQDDDNNDNPLWLNEGRSYMFYDPRAYLPSLRPSYNARDKSRNSVFSAVSKLSSEEDEEDLRRRKEGR